MMSMLPIEPMSGKAADAGAGFSVRGFRESDLDACRLLYVDGLLGGKLAENDTGLDIADIESAYMQKSGSHFWVAQMDGGEVVGMIGVQQHEEGIGEIRRLRVGRKHRRRGIGSALVEAAVRFCNEKEYLKVTLDTFVDREPAIKLFDKFHFRHSKTKQVGEKEMLYFYLDLYQGEKKAGSRQ
jgi:ribosomal protein S18 acetylase RimI-like enzyme